MRAFGIDQFGDINKLKEFDLPLPLPKRGEVRVRLRAVAFNPVDTKIRRGLYEDPLPRILGADGSGMIDAVGDPYGEFSIGDEVIVFAFGQGSNGTYAEYVTLPLAFVVKKPRNITFEEAASIPLVGLTAFQALILTGAVKEGAPLFIAGGGGGVGSMAINLARAYNAGPIFTTASSPESAKLLPLPRDQIIIYTGKTVSQMKDKLIQLNGGRLFPATFDAVGGDMKKLCFAVADYNGHVSTILREPIPDEFDPFAKSLSIHFIFVGAASYSGSPESWIRYKVQLKWLAKLIEEKKLYLPPIEVLGNLSLETVREAHKRLESGHVKGKLACLIK